MDLGEISRRSAAALDLLPRYLPVCRRAMARHNLVHLFKKHVFARLLVKVPQSQRDLVHTLIFSALHAICQSSGLMVLRPSLMQREPVWTHKVLGCEAHLCNEIAPIGPLHRQSHCSRNQTSTMQKAHFPCMRAIWHQADEASTNRYPAESDSYA